MKARTTGGRPRRVVKIEVNKSILGIPLREDTDQAPLRLFASAGMFRQERRPDPGNCRIANGKEIYARQARFVADRA